MRKVLSAIMALTLTFPVLAADYKLLEWEDLVPKDAPGPAAATAAVEHTQAAPAMQAQADAPVVGELDSRKVRLAGFAVPLEGDDDGITEFLLVPYMGACIHVPPPPSNQIVYVKAGTPLPVDYIYDAFWVEGTIKVGSVSSELAQAGYSLIPDSYEIYEYE
ncbi:DUF3299 domain-containing protein [Hahella ganghwensis]|uniref:DUF3299 domain-containing protein n=1 Tax=Hahella ganghwensis TaxID=286420 RepID=UPI00036A2927|nr:DUF3299 domain-containing protein [Hahella ganghwensis]